MDPLHRIWSHATQESSHLCTNCKHDAALCHVWPAARLCWGAYGSVPVLLAVLRCCMLMFYFLSQDIQAAIAQGPAKSPIPLLSATTSTHMSVSVSVYGPSVPVVERFKVGYTCLFLRFRSASETRVRAACSKPLQQRTVERCGESGSLR